MHGDVSKWENVEFLFFSTASGRNVKFDLFIHPALVKGLGCAWPWEHREEKAEPCSHGKTGQEQWKYSDYRRAGCPAQSEGSTLVHIICPGNQMLELKLQESLELYLTDWLGGGRETGVGTVLQNLKVSVGRTCYSLTKPNSPHLLVMFSAECCLWEIRGKKSDSIYESSHWQLRGGWGAGKYLSH